MTCGVNVFIVRLEHAILYPEGINTKTTQRVVLGGSKIGVKSFVLCWYENEPYTPLLFCTRFKQGETVFFVRLPLRHLQAAGARTDKMESRHLEL